jgi:septum formation inhibitor MinC
VDSEKSTMTVTGTVDPVDVIVQARKAGRRASVISIGAPPKSAEEKKPEQQQQQQQQQQQGDEKKTAAADAEKKTAAAGAEKKTAAEQPTTVFVHHHVPSWPACPRYQERVVYEQEPPPCSIM